VQVRAPWLPVRQALDYDLLVPSAGVWYFYTIEVPPHILASLSLCAESPTYRAGQGSLYIVGAGAEKTLNYRQTRREAGCHPRPGATQDAIPSEQEG